MIQKKVSAPQFEQNSKNTAGGWNPNDKELNGKDGNIDENDCDNGNLDQQHKTIRKWIKKIE